MIAYFTDGEDLQLQRELHATRTLHKVVLVRNPYELRAALVCALTYQGQVVLSDVQTPLLKRLKLAMKVVGRTATTIHKYLLAGPHASEENVSVRATPVAPMLCGQHA